MATIRAYTTIEQSHKLTEILPLESADMCWTKYIDDGEVTSLHATVNYGIVPIEYPCWSLAALLNVIPTLIIPTAFSVKVSTPSLIKMERGYRLTYTGDYTPMIYNEFDVESPIEIVADNPVDACVDMILKLNELNLL